MSSVRVDGLRVTSRSGTPVVEDVSLSVEAGEILGLVGESGSGKTTTALALLGYARRGLRLAGGEVEVAGRSIDRRQRGRVVSYVSQDPGASLNPAWRIGDAIRDMLRAHGGQGGVAAALERVSLPGDRAFARRYPHQLSGGQQQRVAIGVALCCEPPVVVLDEPTTGLDVVTQAQVLAEIRRLRSERGLAMVYVTHDLAVVAGLADRIAVMYAGRIVEQGPAAEVLRRPRHPYTRALVQAIPDHSAPSEPVGIEGTPLTAGEQLQGCPFAPRCPLRIDACEAAVPPLIEVGERHAVRCIRADEVPPIEARRPRASAEPAAAAADAPPSVSVESLRAVYRGARGETVVAAEGVSFDLERGVCLALVGESGSGKTTIARCVAGLHAPSAGMVRIDGEPAAAMARDRTVAQRRQVQIVFQNPGEALNPRQRVLDEIARPAEILRGMRRREARAEAERLLDRVHLSRGLGRRFPRELSGGERQRVGIARALAAGPQVMVCDEITSALDVSVQASVLALLGELRRELGLALLFITHDLGVVASIADHVIVLESGRVRESGAVGVVLRAPEDAYTRRLLAAAPTIAAAGVTEEEETE